MKIRSAVKIMFLSSAIFANLNGSADDSLCQKGNLLRNASFELNDTFNGASMRHGTEYIRSVMAGQGKCRQLSAEGWWMSGNSADGASLEKKVVHSGSLSLSLNPPPGKNVSVFSAPEIPVTAGAVTLSAWVRTSGAKGKLELEFVRAGLKPQDIPPSLSRKQIALPETVAEWTRIQLTAEAPANAAAVAWITIDSGKVLIDDIQLESGKVPTDFNIRPEEFLHLSFKDVPEEQLPFWKEKDDSTRRLLIRNDSRAAIKGSLEIWTGPWSKPKADRMTVIDDFDLDAGDFKTVKLSMEKLKPDACVLVPVLKKDGVIALDGEKLVDSTATIGGVVSNSILKSRAVIRFGITPNIAPAKIFGIGNGMLGYGWSGNGGSWYGGWSLKHFAIAKLENLVCGRGQMLCEDQAYLFAAAGVPLHRMENPNITGGCPENASFKVPGSKGNIDFWNPEGMAFLKGKAEKIGKENGRNPLVSSYQMANETVFQFKDGICATTAADAHFRAWCRERHGSLDALNLRWGTAYKSWNEVEQPASATYADEIMKRPKAEGAAAIDWKASLGNITPEINARMKAVPGRAMDWLRWRTWSSLWMFESFRTAAKKYDEKTLYSTNLCWPNFWPQMCMPFFRKMDVTMLDCQYTSGMPRGLGNPMEMMEILEMAESNAPDKPLWGIEIYVQPQWPAEFTSLQNWAMLAHGMTNNLVFAWGPYSDHGVPKEVKAWEKPNAVPMWMLIDLDGTKLPAYYTNKRSLEEIQRFHGKFDGLSIK
ncbi:MAG: beta-galactosidase, partial [Victivallales bacterium]